MPRPCGVKFPRQASQSTPLRGLRDSSPLADSRRNLCLGLALLSAAIFSLLAGCGKKSLPKNELRGITTEIIAAAHDATGRKTEIAIRPELNPGHGQVATDNLYITLTDPAERAPLELGVERIAQRHHLTFAETSPASGVVRIDLSFDRQHTHTIHVITPVAMRSRPPSQGKSAPRLAIILDDAGYDRAAADSVLALPFPVTVSVLPHLPLSAEVAEEAFRRGDQVMLHLPMESESDGAKPELVELRVGMTSGEVEATLARMLETVPHAVGVNNHQGSRATADPALMAALMPALRSRGLFFIDSRTTVATIAYNAAVEFGVHAASRKVFLDDTPTREAILAQLDLAVRDAERNGSAIAIGHPYPATVAALAEGVPPIESRGISVVFASDLVE